MPLYREVKCIERLPNDTTLKTYCVGYKGTYFRAFYIKEKGRWFIDDTLKTYTGNIEPDIWFEPIEVELEANERYNKAITFLKNAYGLDNLNDAFNTLVLDALKIASHGIQS